MIAQQFVDRGHQAGRSVAERRSAAAHSPSGASHCPVRRASARRRWPGEMCPAVQKAVSFRPSGSNTLVRNTSANEAPPGAGDEHAQHRGAGVVEPPFSWLRQQGERPEAGDPGVGVGLLGRLRRADRGQVQRIGGGDDRPRAGRREHLDGHARAEGEGQQVVVVMARCVRHGVLERSGDRLSTCRFASSGSSVSTGVSRSIFPSAASARVAMAVMGLVVDAIRKSESVVRRAGRRPSANRRPRRGHARPRPPGRRAPARCRRRRRAAATSPNRARPAGSAQACPAPDRCSRCGRCVSVDVTSDAGPRSGSSWPRRGCRRSGRRRPGASPSHPTPARSRGPARVPTRRSAGLRCAGSRSTSWSSRRVVGVGSPDGSAPTDDSALAVPSKR